MNNYSKLNLKQLQELATARYGSQSTAFMMASRYELEHGSPAFRKAPWIMALEQPADAQDLAAIASHENWAKGIREQVRRGDRRFRP